MHLGVAADKRREEKAKKKMQSDGMGEDDDEETWGEDLPLEDGNAEWRDDVDDGAWEEDAEWSEWSAKRVRTE